MPVEAYSKKPAPVYVSFAVDAGVMQTLEGPVAYERGDALVTGVAVERWPIARERFERTYQPAASDGVMGFDGYFVKSPVLVRAGRAEGPMRVELSGGRGFLEAKTGDWIVTAPDGETWVVDESIFRESYVPVDPSAG